MSIKYKISKLKYILFKLFYFYKSNSRVRFEETKFNRLDILKYIQKKIKVKNYNFSYLEIGVQNNEVFKKINTKNKIGVDPFSGGTHRMTSDKFFDSNNENFDLVFIDGLHEYNQCKRDLLNSIKFLNPGGLIILHDLIPKNYLENSVPRISQTWTGDVWKLGVQLTFSKNCKFFIANFDHGVGILKIKSGFELKNIENIGSMNFNDFENNFYNKLPLKTSVEILKEIDEFYKL
jgi:hypothetical protein